jgi:hypothetical protein
MDEGRGKRWEDKDRKRLGDRKQIRGEGNRRIVLMEMDQK